MLEQIEKIREIQTEKKIVLSKEKEICTPILADYALLDDLHLHFCEYMTNRDCPPNMESPYQKKKFLFVALYFFAPKSILGYKLPSGLRRAIARSMKVKSESVVSHYCEDLNFFMEHYRDFSGNVEEFIRITEERLKQENLI